MGPNAWIRQIHRWSSMFFTVTVIACFATLAQEEPTEWVFYIPLLPLALLFFSGLYLFVLPHAIRWRNRGSLAGTT